MPQPRKHRDNAAKQKAYRARQKAKREAAQATGGRVDTVEQAQSFVERVQAAGNEAISEFFGR